MILHVAYIPVCSWFAWIRHVKWHLLVIFYVHCPELYLEILPTKWQLIWHLYAYPRSVQPPQQLYLLNLPTWIHYLQYPILPHLLLHRPTLNILWISQKFNSNLDIGLIGKNKLSLHLWSAFEGEGFLGEFLEFGERGVRVSVDNSEALVFRL